MTASMMMEQYLANPDSPASSQAGSRQGEKGTKMGRGRARSLLTPSSSRKKTQAE